MLSTRRDKAKSRDEMRRARWIWAIIAGLAIVALVSATRTALPSAGSKEWKTIRIVSLERALQLYPFVMAAMPLVGIVLIWVTIEVPRNSTFRRRCPRLLLLWGTLGLTLLTVEGLAVVTLAWQHRMPAFVRGLKAKRPIAGSPRSDVNIVVVGESSAEGVPYRDWVSSAKMVVWQLRTLFPSRMFHLEVQARAGWTLEQMHQKLAELKQAPDAIIVYAGHNEFASRYGWSHEVPYYKDERSSDLLSRMLVRLTRRLPLYRLIEEALQRERVAMRPPPATRRIVDAPSHTPDQREERLADFQRRLEAIADFCKQAEILAVFVVPPGNDAGYEPNRSVLPADTPKAEREAFAREVSEARALERVETTQAMQRYRDLIARQPEFAETHFRLARLLEKSGDSEGAYWSYVRARDLDGHPMRCPTVFQNVYKDVAYRCNAIVVDGQAVFRSQGPGGQEQLDDRLFNDAMHPSFEGQVILAETILSGLKAREAFGWPAEIEAAKLDRAECARHFDLYEAAWRAAADFGAGFYGIVTPIRFDPAERIFKQKRYAEVVRALDGGRKAESLDFPGIGVHPVLDRFRP